ncbi:MAG: thiol-disulfide oxidoreductase ResA [Bacilli bacterium]
MNKRTVGRTVILGVLFALVAYSIYANFIDKKGVLSVGDAAPDFQLVAQNGETYRLSELKGKGVVVNFWGTWCKPCEKEMPAFRDNYEAFKEVGVELLAVNVGETDVAVDGFSRKYDLNFPVLIDRNQDVMNAYHVNPLPVTFFVDENGIVTHIQTGTMSDTDVKRLFGSIVPKRFLKE